MITRFPAAGYLSGFQSGAPMYKVATNKFLFSFLGFGGFFVDKCFHDSRENT